MGRALVYGTDFPHLLPPAPTLCTLEIWLGKPLEQWSVCSDIGNHQYLGFPSLCRWKCLSITQLGNFRSEACVTLKSSHPLLVDAFYFLRLAQNVLYLDSDALRKMPVQKRMLLICFGPIHSP